MKALIDTNILIHAVVTSDKRKHDIAASVVQQCFKDGGYISLQNIGELYFRSKKNLDYGEMEVVKSLALGILKSKNWIKLFYNDQTMHKVISNDREHFDFWDSVLYFTMLENGITTIITENEKDFKRFGGIEVINPFKQ